MRTHTDAGNSQHLNSLRVQPREPAVMSLARIRVLQMWSVLYSSDSPFSSYSFQRPGNAHVPSRPKKKDGRKEALIPTLRAKHLSFRLGHNSVQSRGRKV